MFSEEDDKLRNKNLCNLHSKWSGCQSYKHVCRWIEDLGVQNSLEMKTVFQETQICAPFHDVIDMKCVMSIFCNREKKTFLPGKKSRLVKKVAFYFPIFLLKFHKK